MAKSKKTNALKRLIVIGATLIVLQVVYIYLLGDNEPDTSRDAINKQIDRMPGSSSEKDKKRILAAIFDYRTKNNGKLPASLNELMPTYFDRVPVDGNTGKPFKYLIENNNPIVGEKMLLASNGTSPKLSKDAQDTLIASLDDDSQKAAFVYDSTGKRDPFRPFSFAPKAADLAGKTPLEKYSIGQLKLTAVLGQGDEASAMVENAMGKGFSVKKGTKIGSNDGEVVQILPDKLLILEEVTDFTGQTKTRTIEMRLRTKDKDSETGSPSQ